MGVVLCSGNDVNFNVEHVQPQKLLLSRTEGHFPNVRAIHLETLPLCIDVLATNKDVNRLDVFLGVDRPDGNI